MSGLSSSSSSAVSTAPQVTGVSYDNRRNVRVFQEGNNQATVANQDVVNNILGIDVGQAILAVRGNDITAEINRAFLDGSKGKTSDYGFELEISESGTRIICTKGDGSCFPINLQNDAPSVSSSLSSAAAKVAATSTQLLPGSVPTINNDLGDYNIQPPIGADNILQNKRVTDLALAIIANPATGRQIIQDRTAALAAAAAAAQPVVFHDTLRIDSLALQGTGFETAGTKQPIYYNTQTQLAYSVAYNGKEYTKAPYMHVSNIQWQFDPSRPQDQRFYLTPVTVPNTGPGSSPSDAGGTIVTIPVTTNTGALPPPPSDSSTTTAAEEAEHQRQLEHQRQAEIERQRFTQQQAAEAAKLKAIDDQYEQVPGRDNIYRKKAAGLVLDHANYTKTGPGIYAQAPNSASTQSAHKALASAPTSQQQLMAAAGGQVAAARVNGNGGKFTPKLQLPAGTRIVVPIKINQQIGAQ